jgi:hypothetical protein
MAGGERQTTPARMALAGLAAALRGLSPVAKGAPPTDVIIETTSPDLARHAAFLATLGAGLPDAGPEADLDLWAQIATAAAGRRLSVTPVKPDRGTPAAFTDAWAELARDKAKASGAFSAAIPKSNLAKIPGLEG